MQVHISCLRRGAVGHCAGRRVVVMSRASANSWQQGWIRMPPMRVRRCTMHQCTDTLSAFDCSSPRGQIRISPTMTDLHRCAGQPLTVTSRASGNSWQQGRIRMPLPSSDTRHCTGHHGTVTRRALRPSFLRGRIQTLLVAGGHRCNWQSKKVTKNAQRY